MTSESNTAATTDTQRITRQTSERCRALVDHKRDEERKARERALAVAEALERRECADVASAVCRWLVAAGWGELVHTMTVDPPSGPWSGAYTATVRFAVMGFRDFGLIFVHSGRTEQHSDGYQHVEGPDQWTAYDPSRNPDRYPWWATAADGRTDGFHTLEAALDFAQIDTGPESVSIEAPTASAFEMLSGGPDLIGSPIEYQLVLNGPAFDNPVMEVRRVGDNLLLHFREDADPAKWFQVRVTEDRLCAWALLLDVVTGPGDDDDQDDDDDDDDSEWQ